METDVVIAGAGPVGLLLAAELRLHGVGVVVLERLARPDERSRAQALHGRTIPTLDLRGLLGRFLAEQRKLNGGGGDSHRKRPLPKAHFAGITGLAAPPHEGALPPVVFVPQAVTARLLADRARELGAEIRYGAEVTDFTQYESGVTVHFGWSEVRALFLVGCDGSRSVVREHAGIAFEGTAATLTTLAGEVTLGDAAAAPSGWRRTPRGCTVISPHPAGGPSRVVAIDFAGPAAHPGEPVTLAELRSLVEHVHDREIPMTGLTGGQRYGDAARQATAYRHGRVLLAGDAAHVHYPVGGQGLNVGLQDAVNLGWKLAAEVRGHAPDGLLDTYQAERHPVAAAVLRLTRAQVALLNPDERLDPVRELVAELIGFAVVGRHLADQVSAANVAYPPLDRHAHPLTGRFAPDLVLVTADGERRLAEFLHGGRGVLVLLGGHRPDPAAGQHVDVVTADCPERTDLGVLLVRPDGYVAFAAGAAESSGGLETALRQWFGTSETRQESGAHHG
ncbi:2-polyprenyl-6-methoxyphenol hydroxylase [Amycolatopsis xylanica]|uniref:2-polyprenyl-6-methoxyphenol hydroxylase n=1 Tax=Amycolatopsis xylanica TaxID=589385 RepID=A0A1H2VR82_9PSEU|nr:FAD-dependent monooxygenase [Amycolatopsis xylanica]SDW70902.1 2-polyprenyl-6-methoxyphenol hydroxylase [Amycolatopsis xylanica]